MYNSQRLAISIKNFAKSKKIPVGKMLSDCKLSINTLSSMQSGGYYPRLESIVRIADYLGCSVDYLLGRTEDSEIASGASIVNNSTVSEESGKCVFSNECAELMFIYKSLDVRQRIRLLRFAFEIADETGSGNSDTAVG